MIPIPILILILVPIAMLWHKTTIPKSRSRKIPTIPFWVSFYDYCRGFGRLAFYEHRLRPLMEEYGAVNVWIAGHWSILVTKPEYLVEIFRNERVIAKAGFRTKVPWGVFARYFGESVITAHGDTWKVFHNTVRPAITRPVDVKSIRLRAMEMTSAITNRKKLLPADKQALVIDELVQQWTISIFGDFFLDIDFGKLDEKQSVLAQLSAVQSQMKMSFPSPIFSEFPALEKFPWLFRSRQRAFDNIDRFEDLLLKATDQLNPKAAEKDNRTKLVYQLKNAWKTGTISEYHYRSNMKNLFAAGHEDVEQALISLIWTLAVKQELQARLREEVDKKLPFDYEECDLKELPFLSATVYEILRIYPPIFQLTNRITLESTVISDIPIPAGVYIGWNAYGVHTNPKVWGSDAKEFNPDRWGKNVDGIHSMWRAQQVKGNYITFNGYTRKCLGANFAIVQLMIGICELVRQFKWTKDPSYKLSVTTGPILSPHNPAFLFEERTPLVTKN